MVFALATGSVLAKPDSTLPDRDGRAFMASTDMTYLELSYATMRRQLADEALDDAAQTLSWIRRVAPHDEVASVLAAELQLRRGNVAIAAMTLLDITERQDVDLAAKREAERTMSVLAGWSGLDGIIVSDAMLDQVMMQAVAVGIQTPRSPRRVVDSSAFAYAVDELPATTVEQQSSLAGFADSTPAMEMAMAAGRTLSPPPAANSNIQVASALAPPPSVPDAGPRDLIDLVFDDPTNLELNFALFQQQMATGDLDGAASTLERVLLVDPRSKLAKVLMADVSIRKGDLILARNILGNLLGEEDTPADMSERAETLLAEVETRLDPTKYQARLAMEYGRTENAFGRAESDEILFLNLPVVNNTPNRSDDYASYDLGFDVTRELNRQTPTLLEAGITVTGRDTSHRDLSDVRTISANLSLTQLTAVRLLGGLFASTTAVNRQSFNRNAGLFAAVVTPLGAKWEASQSISISWSKYAQYPGIANSAGRSERSVVAKLGLSRQFRQALVNLAISVGRSRARNRLHDLDFKKAEVTMAGMVGDFSVTGSVSRQWTQNKHADLFVSPLVPTKRQDVRSVKFRYPRGSSIGDFYFIPYFRMTSHSTKANIPNNRREGSEAAFGIETVF
jgi:thioredoxin-like negative regulator of GroEL